MSTLARYSQDLNEWANQLRSRASQVVRKTAINTASDARLAAPVDTGNLRNSITMTGRTGDLIAAAEATAEYAAFVEFGHRIRSGGYVPPQPFMRPAQDRNTGPFIDAITQLAEEL